VSPPTPVKDTKFWLNQINELQIPQVINIMNVCGGHERTLAHAGIRSILPSKIKIIPGPGCPVCVCSEETIQFAINLSRQENIVVVSFGDMLRVPTNLSRSKINSLELANAHDGDVIPISSPQEAINYANKNPAKKIVFFAAGFETTCAPIAAMIEQGIPENLSLLLALKKTWPIVYALLDDRDNNIDALIAPGHVATIMGSKEWEFINKQFSLPCAIGGFTETSLLAAIYSVIKQSLTKTSTLENRYSLVVNDIGNTLAQQIIERCFHVSDSNWRGIGTIRNSGFSLRETYAHLDAEKIYQHFKPEPHDNIMPPGCECSAVVLGKLNPVECKLYESACTPEHPIGPCMVSDEGACHIWWSAGERSIKK